VLVKEIIFIQGGDGGLTKAKAALEAAQLPFVAWGWASDLQRPRPQIRVRNGDLEATLHALQVNEVKHVYILGQQVEG